MGILVRHHHERFNGSGFPDQRRGDKIPIGSRIIALADQFERLLEGKTEQQVTERALNKIKFMLGAQFDPDLFKFLAHVAEENIVLATPKQDRFEMELSPQDLIPGMTISRDIRSGTGLLLLSKGSVLNDENVHALRRCFLNDPSKTGIYICLSSAHTSSSMVVKRS